MRSNTQWRTASSRSFQSLRLGPPPITFPFGNNMDLSQLKVAFMAVAAFGFVLYAGSIPAFWYRKRVRFAKHVIEIRSNPLGWETILLDSKVVHSKFAPFGGTYKFMMGQDDAEVRMRPRWHPLALRVRFT